MFIFVTVAFMTNSNLDFQTGKKENANWKLDFQVEIFTFKQTKYW